MSPIPAVQKAGLPGVLTLTSVTANEIADALTAKGVEVDKRRIELGHPIKNLGVHDVEVRLHRDVSAQIQVEVVPIGVEKFEEPAEQQPTTT